MFPIEKTTQIYDYIQNTFAHEPVVLHEYQKRATEMNIFQHQVSAVVGTLLHLLVQATQARSVLEVGTLWGYSSWWLSSALPTDGTLITLEKHEKHYNFAHTFFQEQSLHQIDVRLCDALQELHTFAPEQFDFVFLDADKAEYPQFLELITPLIAPGGMFVADNVLYSSNWNGETTADTTDNPRIQATKIFNQMIADSPEYISLPLAIDSGLMLAYKK